LGLFSRNTKKRYATWSDADLVLAFQKSLNTDFIGVLFDRYGHLVYGVGLKYLQNADDSKDLVMRVFEKVMEDLKRMKVTHFKSWLYQVSKNQCLMDLRKHKNSQNAVSIELLENSLKSDEEESHFSIRELKYGQLEKAVQQLKDEQKWCIQLFYLEELSYQQITEKTHFTLKDVKSFIQNGKRNLKILLEKDSVFTETINASTL
jgi:RNA polymerase sigma factor (sigma-70 family)